MAKAQKKGKTSSKEARRRKARTRAKEVQPPRMGHEAMLSIIPGLRDAADAVLEALRNTTSDLPELLEAEHLELPAVEQLLLERYQLVRQLYGWSHEDCEIEAQQLCCHLSGVVDFEVAGRKAFWVAPELTEQLANTSLDISGELLKLPFPTCAFIFRDSLVCELADSLTAESRNGPPTRVVTAYARPIPDEFGEEGLRLMFLFDGFDGQWPYLLQRDVPTAGTANIDEILASHPDESNDAFFRKPEVRLLVHLVINAVLYTTSDAFKSERRAPAPKGTSTSAGNLSGEEVYYLPGRITIHGGEVAAKQAGGDGLRSVGKRFWVRGHWRRANPNWTEQRLRWVQPYLKGPDMAAIVERQYDLAGPPEATQAPAEPPPRAE